MKITAPSVPSLLGPVPVLEGREVDDVLRRDGLLGTYNLADREIRVRSDIPDCSAYQVLGHEMMHMILGDSGISNLLAPKMEEALCDAFGTWFAVALQSGKLSLK